VLILGMVAPAMAQLNPYKYVVVPKRFQEFDEENKYHSSTLLKHLLVDIGFTAYYEGDIPKVSDSPCEGLRIGLLDESNLLRTRVVLILKDCNGKEVFRTQQGSSRKKDLREGYDEAIRDAFHSIEALNYRYEPSQPSTAEEVSPPRINFDKDVKKLEESTEAMPSSRNPMNDPAVEETASPQEQRYKSMKPLPSHINKMEATDTGNKAETWYAQSLANGYQLVDRSPKIRLRLYNTALPDVYLAEDDMSHGLVYKRDDRWFYEYYEGGEKVSRELHINF